MTVKKIQHAAYVRGMIFTPKLNIFGFYEIYDGERFQKADTLDGIYKIVMTKPVIKD